MKAFLKENIVLVISLSLPLILVILFSIIQFASNVGIANPKHVVVFTTGNANRGIGYNVFVKDNEIHYAYRAPNKANKNTSYYNSNKPRVFIYDPISETRTELEAPTITNFKSNTDIILKDRPKGKIISKIESPDGYILETSNYRNRNVFSSLFGGYDNRTRYEISLKKNNKRIAIPNENYSGNNYYNRNSNFLGWIVKD